MLPAAGCGRVIAVAIAIGILVGLVLGLTGAGGSIIAVPLLMAVLGMPQTEAAPVALIAVTLAAALGTTTAWLQGLVRYRAAILMACVGMLLTPLGVRTAHQLPDSALALLFAAVVAIVALRMWLQARAQPTETRVVAARASGGAPGDAICRVNPETGRIRWNSRCAGVLALTGALTGMLSGLLGIGGGFVVVPALRQATQLTIHGAVATSLMVVTLVSGAAAASAVIHGAVPAGHIVLPFAAGTVFGMAAGRVLAPRLAGPKLQSGFAALLLVVAAGMMARGLDRL